MVTNRLVFAAAAVCLFFASCKKENPNPTPDPQPIAPGLKGLIFSNEGQFGQGNASISFLANGSSQPAHFVYQGANNVPIGDVLQSITKSENGYLLAVNGSGLLIRTDLNFKKTAQVSLSSPRYVYSIGSTKAYVSELFAGNIHVVDPTNLSTSQGIITDVWVERMIGVNGNVWCVDKTLDRILIFNPQNDEFEGAINLTAGAADLVLDKDNMVWVMCQGPWDGSGDAIIHKINPTTQEVVLSLTAGLGGGGGYLRTNGAKDRIFYSVDSSIYSLGINETTIPVIADLTVGFWPYCLDIDPVNGDIYICNAADFTSQGSIHRFNSAGIFLNEYTAGINPNGVYFFAK
jgi:DNA-binding beta-propeller fold protein YncE